MNGCYRLLFAVVAGFLRLRHSPHPILPPQGGKGPLVLKPHSRIPNLESISTHFTNLAFLALSLFVVAAGVHAQAYPNKPIRIIVPFAAGGGNDTLARMIAEKLNQSWGQPVIVENRVGADSRIGTELIAKASPDGYTFGVVSTTHAIVPGMMKNLPYDAAKDFTSITLAAVSPNVLVVNPSVPAKTMAEFVKLAKARPGKLNYATAGRGSSNTLTGVMLGLDLTNVPYKGASEAVTAVLGGHVEMSITSLATSLRYLQAGTLRALAVTSARRSALAPDVPTMEESGFTGFATPTWYGVIGPAGMPKSLVTRINAEIVKILNMPDINDRMLKLGLEPSPMSVAEFDAYIRSELVKWGKAVKAAGIQPK